MYTSQLWCTSLFKYTLGSTVLWVLLKGSTLWLPFSKVIVYMHWFSTQVFMTEYCCPGGGLLSLLLANGDDLRKGWCQYCSKSYGSDNTLSDFKTIGNLESRCFWNIRDLTKSSSFLVNSSPVFNSTRKQFPMVHPHLGRNYLLHKETP